MTYVERVERHFEVEFYDFNNLIDVLLPTEKQDIWHTEQRNQDQRGFCQLPGETSLT